MVAVVAFLTAIITSSITIPDTSVAAAFVVAAATAMFCAMSLLRQGLSEEEKIRH
jgi:hypothetical protein